MPRQSPEVRFWKNVDKTDSCWIYTGHKIYGYGRIFVNNRTECAHRYSWCLKHKQSIPDGQLVRHMCDNPSCVNPDHLELGTHQDNANDRNSRNRQAKGSSHGKAKLSEQQVRLIKLRLQDNLSHQKIAEEFGVRHGTIHAIAVGRSWSHIKIPHDELSSQRGSVLNTMDASYCHPPSSHTPDRS